jgi:hypothetical protein
MPQQQSQRDGEPPLGSCAECGEPITREDPGRLELTVESGAMRHVHDRCRAQQAGTIGDPAS